MIPQKIRHHQQGFGLFQRLIAGKHPAVELVDGVEVKGGDAGLFKHRPLVNHLPGGLHLLVGGDAVGPGIFDQDAFFIQQPIVHPPGVDAKAAGVKALLPGSHKAALHLADDMGQVPVAQFPLGDEVVFKAAHPVQVDLLPVKAPDDAPAIGSADVKCQKLLMLFHAFPSASFFRYFSLSQPPIKRWAASPMVWRVYPFCWMVWMMNSTAHRVSSRVMAVFSGSL